MASDYAALMGRFYVSSFELDLWDDFAEEYVATSTLSGWYYIDDYAGSESFIGDLQTAIRSWSGESPSVTQSNVYYYANGFISIDLGPDQTNIKLDSTAEQDILGSSAQALGNAATFNMDKRTRYVWRPSRKCSYPMQKTQASSDDLFFSPNSRTIIGRTNDGTTFSVEGNMVYDSYLTFVNLPTADVLRPATGGYLAETDNTDTGPSFERFWLDVISKGQPVRIFMDRDDVYLTSNYSECIVGEENQEALGSFLDYTSRHLRNYQGLWDVELRLMKAIERTTA